MDFGRLIGRIGAAAATFPEDFRNRHADYLVGLENAQGGFAGRAGTTDPYYTAFGLAGLALLGRWSEPLAERARKVLVERFLTENLLAPNPGSSPSPWESWSLAELLGLIAWGSLVQGSSGGEGSAGSPSLTPWDQRAAKLVEEFLSLVRRPDGGYAKHPASPTSSTYATFLGSLLESWLGLPMPEPEKTGQMLLARQREDGGFAEWPSVRQSGTNPTAAAVGWWSLIGRMPPSVRDRAAAFLVSMQSDEGGFRAHARLPIADLLSTFTALVALELLETPAAVDRQAACRYVRSLELPQGGFRAGAWDASSDVEYTFYGLASLALLADTGSSG